ncbi:MAG: hypothetical protein L0332_07035 [Chloroflexi bacterium]|nr:hypothetical protein [Chloroflexota bacterium]MCI0579172.1 hypothetical protein [Chloroflexota bacterium]MCI0647953.1 hypothetical protein [Chloroflexota bacterium]MCI0726463.1 hypothetical protein [Chloroflexota bacterium]
MSMYYEDDLDVLEEDEFSELFDSLTEEDDGYEVAEAFGRRRRPKVAGGQRYARPRLARKPVSQADFQNSLDRVSKDMKTNAQAIKAINLRQERDAAQIKKSLRKSRDMSLFTLLLTQHPPTTVSTFEVPQNITEGDPDNSQTVVIPKGTKLVTDVVHQSGLDTNLIFLLLLMMGNNGWGDKMNGDENSLFPLLFLLTQQQGGAAGASNTTLNNLLPVFLLMGQN